VAALHEQVAAVLGRGDVDRAARLLGEAPARLQREPAIERDIDQVLTAARNDAERAQRRVPRANTSSTEYRQGVQLQTQGSVLGQDGRKLDAATTFLQASQSFGRAATAAAVAAATTSVPLAAATSSVSPQATTTTPLAATTTVTATATPPVTVAAPPATVPAQTEPAGPTPAQDTAAIRRVLQQYIDGYQALDLSAIRRAYPGANANFKDARAYELELLDVQIDIQGNRATVTCRRSVRQTGRSGRPNANIIPTVFGMRRNPAGWIIEEVR
jgi:hypothetical protein